MRRALVLLTILLVQACIPRPGPQGPGLGDPVAWETLQGWKQDQHAAAWPALLRSCSKLGDRAPWAAPCRAAAALDDPTDARARAFFERWFEARPLHGSGGRRQGLITGYYEPLLRGSFEPGGRYRHPLYAPPSDLLTIDLGEAYPELDGKQLRGRLSGGRVVPYPERARLHAEPGALAGSELLWVDDPVDLFFLHVQGSGRVRLPDGSVVGVGFADHNGRPYRSIGRRLVETGELDAEEVDLFSIRRWLNDHPERAEALLHHNPRYIFFTLREDPGTGPVGSLNVPLAPGRSLAVDRDAVPLGSPVWLETSFPGAGGGPMNRLMMAQDTGAAIEGAVRADVFWGQGDEAERLAGLMKQPGRMYVLVPRSD